MRSPYPRRSRRPATRRDSERGFTLIELLVSLGILGMLAAMLLAGLGMTGIVSARTRSQVSDLDSVTTAQTILRGRLQRLRSVTRLTSAEPLVDADGDPRSFSFVGPPIDRAAPDTLYRYRVMLTAAGDLTLYSASILDSRVETNDPAMTGWAPTRLMSGATGVSIAYFGADPINGGRRWQDHWVSRPQPPDLVRVRVSFPAGDKRRWPDLVVRPRATVNSACRIDAFSGRCEAVL